MRRYWLEKSAFQNNQVHINGDTYHHIIDVCRLTVGNKFEVLGFGSKAWVVELTEVGKKSAVAVKIDEREIQELPKPRIILCLSVARFQVMDSVVERAVEMGVSEIRPFFSDFSFVRSSSTLPQNKVERWQKIIVSATQQCGRGDLLNLHTACTFSELFKNFNNPTVSKMGLFAYEGAANNSIRQFAEKIHTELDEIWVFVGSEGGFSTQEVQQIQDLGLAPVSLGDQVLRVETACIALIAVLKYECGLLRPQSGGTNGSRSF